MTTAAQCRRYSELHSRCERAGLKIFLNSDVFDLTLDTWLAEALQRQGKTFMYSAVTLEEALSYVEGFIAGYGTDRLQQARRAYDERESHRDKQQ